LLKRVYGIQPVIPPEVELRSLTKYAKRIDAPLTKALKNSTLLVLTHAACRNLYGSAADALHPAIQSLGARYRIVGPGEAYCHAAGVTLGVPVLSNDRKAVLFLSRKGLSVGVPTLSAFDLLIFGYQIGCLREQDCDGFRYQMLERERNESVPAEFRNASVKDGLTRYTPRLLDNLAAVLGVPAATGCASYDTTLFVSPIPPPSPPRPVSDGTPKAGL
jgi:hypothetical protein